MKHPEATSENLAKVETLGELFSLRACKTPHAEAYRQFDAVSSKWVSHTWEQIAAAVDMWCHALDTLQFAHGARVAILLPNGVDAICVDQGSLALGLVPVPMHTLDNPASIGYILNDCQASMLVLSDHSQWRAIASTCSAMQHLELVVLTGGGKYGGIAADAPDWPQVRIMQEWLSSGISDRAGGPSRRHAVSRDDLAAIVYTSGTTGRPKGVMLTHRNILPNIRSVIARVQVLPTDVFLSFLPLSHTFERTIGYYLPIAAGSCVVYARSAALIADDLKIARPTVLVSVPRIYERFYAKLHEELSRSNRVARFLFQLAQTVGWRRFCRSQNLPAGTGWLLVADVMLWPALERMVARTVLAQFGGRLRAAVSGGAPMSQAVAKCFLGLGLPVLQGYCMTETSPVIAANAIDDNWPKTVGRPLDGVEVRIMENNELQVRAESVMKGYWNRPEDTRLVMTVDGWLRTGDQAVMEQGRIRISGRIKETMVASTGEKIAPADLELAISSDLLFEQAMVVGENRPFIAAFVVLNRAAWEDLAAGMQLDPADPANLNAAAPRELLVRRIKEATKQFPYYAVPRAVWATLDAWTVENGLITPTLKLKRNALHVRVSAEIDAIYR